MTSLGSSEVYIPRDACVRSVRLEGLPSSISKKLRAYLRASVRERSASRSSPMATWICPVELRSGAGATPTAGSGSHRTLLPLQGQVWLPVVSASLLSHQLLQEALCCSDPSRPPDGLTRVAAPESSSRVSAGKNHAMILYDGQIFLSVKKNKNQVRRIRDTIQLNGGAVQVEYNGRSQQETIREAGRSQQEPIREAGSSQQEPIREAGRSQQESIRDAGRSQQEPIREADGQSTAPFVTGVDGGVQIQQHTEMVENRARAQRGADMNAAPEPAGKGAESGARSSCVVQFGGVEGLGGEVEGHDALCRSTSAGHDSCGRSLLDGVRHELHPTALPPGPGPQDYGGVGRAGPDLAFLTLPSAAHMSHSYDFEELEQMERVYRLKATLRLKEAELYKLNTLN